MSHLLLWNNLLTYCLQIGLLVGVTAFVPSLLRLRLPGARLVYLQILLAVCLLLPLVQPWKQQVAGDLQVSTTVRVVEQRAVPQGRSIPWREIALGLLAAGMAIRLGWLAVGFRRLRQYRLHSRPMGERYGCPTFLSDDIASPVTFGFRKPVILLPSGFPALDRGMQDAILCHELLHVERHDWIVTVIEEVIRAVFWFHPAIWWVLGEIQLSREQAVDREVVLRTQAREEYVDALLHIAGASVNPEMAPAPLFLRRRHLKQRVVSIFKEVSMSKTRSISGLAVGLAILATACWLVTGAIPLAAAPQVVNDAAGVSVDIGSAALLHRTPVLYPDGARRGGIQGTVTVEAIVDASGNVSDARTLSGPAELRRAALDSILQWHFANGAAGATRTITIGFQLPADGKAAPIRSQAWVSRGLAGRVVKSIVVAGFPDRARNDLLAALPVHEGDTLTAEQIANIEQAVRTFDEHLRMVGVPSAPGEATLQITAPNYIPHAPLVAESKPGTPSQIKVGGNVMQSKLVQQPHPKYPPDAKAARIQGVVKLQAVIAKDGSISKLEVISGEPILVAAALEAVQGWKYEPTLLNGNPVEVLTQIDVNFTLSQ